MDSDPNPIGGVELFTADFRIRGECAEPGRLVDIMNSPTRDLALNDASLTPWDAAKPLSDPAALIVRKSGVVLAGAIDDAPISAGPNRYFIPKRKRRAHIYVPPFSLSGWLHFGTGTRLETLTEPSGASFWAMTEVEARHNARTRRWWAGFLLFNRNFLQAYSFEESDSATAEVAAGLTADERLPRQRLRAASVG